MDIQTSPAASVTQNPNSNSSQPEKNPFKKFNNLPTKKKLLVIGIVILIIIMLLLAYMRLAGKQIIPNGKIYTNGSPDNGQSGNMAIEKPKNAIAKVGDEYIFQQDLDTELANYVGVKDDQAKKVLLDKLVKDSIIIQAANKEKILALNPAVFNSPGKDYGKRWADIKAIETKINSSQSQISGGMVSVWFYNYQPAKIGLEQGKAEAFKRISELRRRVVAKEITMEEAGNIIKKDVSYADLDLGYKNNAFIPFSYNKGKQITVDQNFDNILWKTAPGEVTEVYLGTNFDDKNQQRLDSFYIFGQVANKIDNGSGGFDNWVEAQRKNYEVTYY